MPSEADDVLSWQRMPPGPRKDQALEALLTRFRSVISGAVSVYTRNRLPPLALELEGKREAVKALAEWDPARGALPSSMLGSRVRQRLHRYVTDRQNVARIPEDLVRRIGPMDRAEAELTDTLGRPPSATELADHAGIPLKMLSQIRRSRRADIVSDEGIERFSDSTDYQHALLGYYSLTEQEKVVFDHLTGSHGAQKLSANQVAQKLKVAASRISAIRASIAGKLEPYMTG